MNRLHCKGWGAFYCEGPEGPACPGHCCWRRFPLHGGARGALRGVRDARRAPQRLDRNGLALGAGRVVRLRSELNK